MVVLWGDLINDLPLSQPTAELTSTTQEDETWYLSL